MPPLTVRMEEPYGPPPTRCMPRRLEKVEGGTPRAPSAARLAILASAMAVLSHTSALASCDAIPGRSGAFRGALGVLDRPFARPGDPITLARDPACHPGAPGIPSVASHLAVTYLFTPPAGPANAIVLRTDCTGFAAAARACELQLPGGTATCVTAGPDDLAVVEVDGMRRLRFRLPNTAVRPGGGDPDRTFTGPATIAVTRVEDPLPCELAFEPCADTLGLMACVDDLYLDDGSCGTVPGDPFGHFTALPAPNDFGALCSTPDPPCLGTAQQIRFAIDAAGNVLAPVDWSRVLVRNSGVPVPRLVQADLPIEAFAGSRVPLLLADDGPLGS